MKIHLSIEDAKKAKELLTRQEENIDAANAINFYLDNKGHHSYLEANEKAKVIKPEEAFASSFMPLSKASPSLAKDYGLGGVKLDPGPYLNDPYVKNVHFHKETLGDWCLGSSLYEPYEGFMYDELVIKPENNYQELTPFGFFTEPFPFLEVKQNGVTWMSLTPHEINTMKDAVDEAHGKVITFGLGLGYYVYMAAIKDNVSEVVCIEKDPKIIALFKRFILPQFPHKEKIHIIEDDAFRYARHMKDGEFDYVFVDIWHLPTDGLDLYLNFKKIFKDYTKNPINYWVEKSLLTLYRRAILILFDEERQGSTEEDYDYAATPSDLLVNRLHNKLKNVKIDSYDDLVQFLSEDSLKTIII